MKKPKSKVIFIASVGHSGSTLLDLLCGSINNVFSMGEVHFLSWQLLQGVNPDDPQTYCSCGKGFEDCKFWGKVLNEISKESGINLYKDPKKYDFSLNKNIKRFEPKVYYRILNKFLELSFNYILFRPFSYLVYLLYLPSIKRNWDLYDKTAHYASSKYVVDSSKDFIRYWMLKMYRPKDIKLLVLIRDLKGVASSKYGGLDNKLIKDRARLWLKFYNHLVAPNLHRLKPEERMIVRYEEMCKNPTLTRDRISNFLNYSKINEPLKYLSPYKYHTLQGNPIRLIKNDIEIKYDERWKERLDESEKNWLNKESKKLALKI